MKPYERYVPSGVEWIGDIPEGWGVKKLKYISFLRNIKTDNSELTYIALEHIESNTGKLIKREDDELQPDAECIAFHCDDVLFCKLRPYLAKCILSSFDGKCSSELLVLQESGFLKAKYLFFVALSHGFLEIVNSSTYGSKMPRASWNFIGNMSMPLPDPDTQTAIADYLDRETAKIDSIIKTKETLVERLKEKRLSVISHAVTKGLDPNTKTKPSGVEWIGDIPEGWGVKKLKYMASANDDALPETTPSDYEFKYVDIGSASFVGGITEYQNFCFEEAPSRARRIVKCGDTIVSTVRTYLKAIAPIIHDKNVIVSTGFAVIRPREIYNTFLSYFAKSNYFVDSVSANSVGVSYPAINPTEIMSIYCVFPKDKPNQTAIADYLDTETAKIDSTIEKTKLSIEKLKEYRTALISACVTGKIDVRS